MATAELPVRLPLPGDHFLNRKSTLHWQAHEHYMRNFLIHHFSLSQNPMVHNQKIKIIDKESRMQSESSGRSTDIDIFIKQNCQMNTHMKRKIWIGMKFNARAIWRQPRAGNWAEQLKLIARPPQKHWKLRILWNQEKHAKTSGFIDFSTSNMHFRSADAANHLKCARGTSLRA